MIQPPDKPSLVTAIFAADVDWTLYIQDVNSNTVLSASGSGTSMQFNWDGNGFGETNLPAGVYTYLLSAQTNGEAESIVSGGSGGSGGGGPPSPDFSSTFLGTVVATAPDGSQVVEIPLPPSPPGMSFGLDQNGNEITTTTIVLPPAYFQAAQPLRAASSGVAFSPDNDPDGGGDPPAPPGSQGYSGTSSSADCAGAGDCRDVWDRLSKLSRKWARRHYYPCP